MTHATASYCISVDVRDGDKDILIAKLDEFATRKGMQIDSSHPIVRRFAGDHKYLIEAYTALGRFGAVIAFYALEKGAGEGTLRDLQMLISETAANKKWKTTPCSEIPGFSMPEVWRH